MGALGLHAALRIHFGWCWLIAVNATTFAVYSADKLAAKLNRNDDGAARGGWRMPEFTLHVLALAGGWPAGLAAQATLRHKTIKPEFQRVFRGIMILEIVAIGAIGLWAIMR